MVQYPTTVDRVVIIDKGRLVTIAALDDLTARMTAGVRVRAAGIQALLPVLADAGLEATVLDGDELLVRGAPAARIGELAWSAGIAVQELVQETSTLEKVFLELTSGSEP
jgi:ABC-2 type transport system ATP-binding protein